MLYFSGMQKQAFKISARVWLYQGNSPWHFITIEKTDADEIKKADIWPRRGFGSIPVNVHTGQSTWKTSIFPDKNGTYILPLKKEIRAKEKLHAGDTITVNLELNTS